MPDTLMVGVSGVRGIVGRDLTPEFVARYAAAFGTWAAGRVRRARGRRRAAVVLGRDARTSGPMFAAAAQAGLMSVGCDVIDIGLVLTPSAQLAVEYHGAAGGIVLTASHNPIEWNALKFVGPDGIFLDPAAGADVGALAGAGVPDRADFAGIGVVRTDPHAVDRHVAAVLALPLVATRQVRARRFRVVLDTVRGAAGPAMTKLLRRLGCRVMGFNTETDGLFPRPPEPVPEHLKPVGALVRRHRAHIGFAVDPDGDRLAILDEQGRPIGEDYTVAFAVRAVLGPSPRGRARPARGATSARRPVVVCNLSTSLVVDDAAHACGARVVRTPVGEAHVARAMLAHGAPVGGEGNGGAIYPALHAGRDAPVAAALALSLLARERCTVSELVGGAPRYAIVKAKVTGVRRERLPEVYEQLRERFADAAVDQQDGLRLAWADRWLHVRPSNTEPVVRLIAEAPTRAAAAALVEEGQGLCAGS